MEIRGIYSIIKDKKHNKTLQWTSGQCGFPEFNLVGQVSG